MNQEDNVTLHFIKKDDPEETKSISSSAKRGYRRVGYDKRKELLHIIENDQVTIKAAAKRLNVNYSTAKNIVKLFRQEKRISPLTKRIAKIRRASHVEQHGSTIREKGHVGPENRIRRFVAKKTHLEFETEKTKERKDSSGAAIDSAETGRKVSTCVTDYLLNSVPCGTPSETCPVFNFYIYGPMIARWYDMERLISLSFARKFWG